MEYSTQSAGNIIIHLVAHTYSISTSDLLSLKRENIHISGARQVAMYLMHTTCGLPQGSVGKMFCRDRTTVSHACKVIENHRDNPEEDYIIHLLERAILCQLDNVGAVEQ